MSGRVALWIAFFVLAACGEKHRTKGEEGQKSRSAAARSSKRNATPSLDNDPSSWLPSEIYAWDNPDQFYTSMDECRTKLRSRLPLELADMFIELGYDTAIQDVCLSLEAFKKRSPEMCTRLSVAPAQRNCHRKIAIARGDPMLCPRNELEGREATCVAWSTGSVSACQFAREPERVRCRAVATGDPTVCNGDIPSARGRCLYEVKRYGKLGQKKATRSERYVSTSHLEIDARKARRGEETLVKYDQIIPWVEAGVRLGVKGCSYTVQVPLIVRPSTDHPDIHKQVGELKFRIPVRAKAPIKLEWQAPEVEMFVDPLGESSWTSYGGTGTVDISRLETTWFGRLEFSFRTSVARANQRFTVYGTVATFVRDVDVAPNWCPNPPS